MTDTILLDLNSTYAANASEVHLMHKGIYNVKREVYRSWLTDMLRDRHVLMLTSRPHHYRAETLEHIQQLEQWQPELALFNSYRLKAPDAKRRMLEEVVFPQFGTPDERSYVAIESNWKTQEMFTVQGIRSMTQQELQKRPSLLDSLPVTIHEPSLF